MPLLENLDSDSKNKLYLSVLKKGDVLLKKFAESDHPKFFIIAGMNADKVFVCSVFINSEIHPSLRNKPKLLRLQIPIQKTENSFLRYDSFVNCAYPIKLNGEHIASQINDGTCKPIGRVASKDLEKIQQTLIGSGLLSDEEIELYFNVSTT
ncbi:MAG: hypothetical protein QM786_09940 [Breznakibacter sp.]